LNQRFYSPYRIIRLITKEVNALSLYMFRTALSPEPAPFQLDHQSQIVLLGSCFSENIGERLSHHKFKTSINPFGTLFHPFSIFNLISKTIDQSPLDDWSILDQEDLHLSHQLHSSFKADSPKALQHSFQASTETLLVTLKEANLLVLTLGTAFAYQLERNGEHVANCHKVPQSQFTRRLTSSDEIHNAFETVYQKLKALNPLLKVLLTVSPVRHTKDGLKQNSVSKSILRTAAELVKDQFEDVFYFPAYEIMMDDLRDYRFYDKDMIHPNEQAIDYIWDLFGQSYFSPATQALSDKIAKLKRSVAHKAFNPTSPAHQIFLKRTLAELMELNEQLPFDAEIEAVKSQLLND
jgi:hypothetical protein